ncbi:MAG: hypothetical protein M3Y85_04375 [Bacteroidota bacterium]|nr:hypothetical protein [Bacteroidota bacterium]
MRLFVFPLLSLIIFSSCTNNPEIVRAGDVKPENIYYDYKVSGEEGNEEVTIMLQYRQGGKNGPALELDSPSKVSIDGVELKTNNAGITGTFYEAIKPAESFKGPHTIIFTDKNNHQHKEEFEYHPFFIDSDLRDKIKKEPFTIRLSPLPSLTTVRLVMTDTAFETRDVNEILKIERGELKIDSQMLANLKSGPVSLEIYREEERPVKNGSTVGGRLQITYVLKREFEFVQ